MSVQHHVSSSSALFLVCHRSWVEGEVPSFHHPSTGPVLQRLAPVPSHTSPSAKFGLSLPNSTAPYWTTPTTPFPNYTAPCWTSEGEGLPGDRVYTGEFGRGTTRGARPDLAGEHGTDPCPTVQEPPRKAAHQYMKIIRPGRPVSTTVGCPIPVPANGTTPLPPDAPTSPGPGICVPAPGAAARSLKA
ncbi:unnamed protein product [Gadus morhua 'NCC']